MDLVSVVLPLYNCENYIKDTLESILNQSYSKLEILVIDDGSTDNSKGIVKALELLDNRITYIYKENGGVSSARNKALENAKGKYIAFLDADDLWDKDKLNIQINKMKATNTDASYTGYKKLLEYGSTSEVLPLNSSTLYLCGKIKLSELNKGEFPQTGTWVIKKDILVNYGIAFTEGCSWGEDIEFFSKVITVSDVIGLEKFTTTYRIRESGSLTSNYNIDSIISSYDTYNRLVSWMETFKNNSLKLNKLDTQKLNENKKNIDLNINFIQKNNCLLSQ